MNKQLFLIIFICYANGVHAGPSVTDNHIKIDQFGYRSADKKIAVISNPQTGYNSNSHFIPGAVYEVRRWNDDSTVYTGSRTDWNAGAVHSQSGDQAWWFDFSALTVPGSYYVYDLANAVGSYRFEIDDCVYENILKQAMRMFYYQRCGTSKALPYTQSGWADSACHLGILQDPDCRLYNNNSVSTSKNLSGGWHDAGDYNKYVNFTFETGIDLLLAYAGNPAAWSDDYNLPESGNGVPDLLDEMKYELDWLLKMQNPDGSVLSIVGVANFGDASPPSADVNTRVYGPATTSASYTASALFALSAVQFNTVGLTTYSTVLRNAAVNAWSWASANPATTFYNSGVIGAGEQETDSYGTLQRQLAAAAFLFAATGDQAYKSFFENNYSQLHLIQWNFAYPFESAAQDVLLYYSSLTGIDPVVRTSIRNAFANSMTTGNFDNLPAFLNHSDAYRAFLSDQNYTWGSNTTKGRQGIMYSNMLTYNLDSANDPVYLEAALGFVNYFHGVNPTAFCYLSNMGSFGAEKSINEFYHSWFADGSVRWDRAGASMYGPAPGYVPGGPNPTYDVDGCCPAGCSTYNNLCNPSLVTPPLGQPMQKSYQDWNTGWPQNSWTVTEAGIYTQASYVRLLSRFVSAACSTTAVVSLSNLFSNTIVYPNPGAGIFSFTIPYEYKSIRIEIVNMLGEKVYSGMLNNQNHSVNIGDHPKGLYFYLASDGENVVTMGKLIIQ